MDYKAVYVGAYSHVDHSSWCFDIHDIPQSIQSCGVFTVYGQHFARYVFHYEDDKLHHDYCGHIVSGANESLFAKTVLTYFSYGAVLATFLS